MEDLYESKGEFESQSKEELLLKVGDLISVTSKQIDDDRWKGKNIKTGHVGIFPSYLVAPYQGDLNDWKKVVVKAYDVVAEVYSEHFINELNQKPFDSKLIKKWSSKLLNDGFVCDLGCGPGHLAKFLHEKCNVEKERILGIDLSHEMVTQACKNFPDMKFIVGDMLKLEFNNNYFAGIAAFYSIIHIKREELEIALKEMYRVLKPNGQLLLSFHRGNSIFVKDNWFEKHVPIICTMYNPGEVSKLLEDVGFVLKIVKVRDPYEFEFQNKRVYIWAEKLVDEN